MVPSFVHALDLQGVSKHPSPMPPDASTASRGASGIGVNSDVVVPLDPLDVWPIRSRAYWDLKKMRRSPAGAVLWLLGAGKMGRLGMAYLGHVFARISRKRWAVSISKRWRISFATNDQRLPWPQGPPPLVAGFTGFRAIF